RLQPRPVAVALLRAEALIAQAQLETHPQTRERLREEARGVLVVNQLSGLPICTGLVHPTMLPVACLAPPRSMAGLWTGLSVLEEQAGRPEAALALLDEADRRLGDLVELRQARALHWARRKGPEALEALAALERGLAKCSPEDRPLLQTTLAQ